MYSRILYGAFSCSQAPVARSRDHILDYLIPTHSYCGADDSSTSILNNTQIFQERKVQGEIPCRGVARRDPAPYDADETSLWTSV